MGASGFSYFGEKPGSNGGGMGENTRGSIVASRASIVGVNESVVTDTRGLLLNAVHVTEFWQHIMKRFTKRTASAVLYVPPSIPHDDTR